MQMSLKLFEISWSTPENVVFDLVSVKDIHTIYDMIVTAPFCVLKPSNAWGGYWYPLSRQKHCLFDKK